MKEKYSASVKTQRYGSIDFSPDMADRQNSEIHQNAVCNYSRANHSALTGNNRREMKRDEQQISPDLTLANESMLLMYEL